MNKGSFLAVAWIPLGVDTKIKTQAEAVRSGGRIVDTGFLPLNAKNAERCLNIGAPQDGIYITVN